MISSNIPVFSDLMVSTVTCTSVFKVGYSQSKEIQSAELDALFLHSNTLIVSGLCGDLSGTFQSVFL